MQEQLCQTAIADRMGHPRIDRERQDVHAEWRAFLHSFRHRRQSHAVATGTVSRVTLYSGYHRTNHGQIDFIVPAMQHLIVIRQHGLTMCTTDGFRDNGLIRIEGQGAASHRR
jgi:hypothetical protein